MTNPFDVVASEPQPQTNVFGNPFDAAPSQAPRIPSQVALPKSRTLATVPPNAGAYAPIIKSSAQMTGIPLDIATRTVQAESSFNPKAVSSTGARGLMQLMPATAKELGVNNVDDPSENVAGGLSYLSKMYRHFGNWPYALAAYNWGPGNVEAWVNRGGGFGHLPKETQDYIRKIAPSELANLQSNGRVALGGAARRIASTNPFDAVPTSAPAATPVPSPQPGAPPPAFKQDESGNTDFPGVPRNPIAEAWTGATHALDVIAGHQDLPYIWDNALERDRINDADAGRPIKSGMEYLRDPSSHLSNAMHMWRTDPVSAMDRYGLNAPEQLNFVAQYGKGPDKAFAQFLLKQPVLTGMGTFFGEAVNPLSLVEGGGAGKVAKLVGAGVEMVPWLAKLHVSDYLAHGMGPLVAIAKRSGVEGTQWAKSMMSSMAAPHTLLGVEPTNAMMEKIFGGLHPHEQNEVISTFDRGDAWIAKVKAAPKDATEVDGVPIDTARRAVMLHDDIKMVTDNKLRVGRLKPTQVRANYFPMKGSYKFDPKGTMEEMLHGNGSASSTQQRTYQTVAEQLASPYLDPEFLPARSYQRFREEGLRSVAFEDSIARAPASLRLPSSKGLRAKIASGPISKVRVDGDERVYRTINGQPWAYAANNKNWVSQALRKGANTPELAKFILKDKKLAPYLVAGLSRDPATMSLEARLPTFVRKTMGIARAMIVSNFAYHPTINIAGNDSAMRALRGMGGPTWEVGGYAYNAAKAVAQQLGLRDPKAFIGGAKDYHDMLMRAFKAGAISAYPQARDTVLGVDRALTTVPAKNWVERMDRSLLKFGDFNADRTFGEKGEESFAVSLFQDGVKKLKLSDAEAGALVRKSLGDMHNFNPDNPLTMVDLFLPWRVGNVRFWTGVLAKKPNLVTSVTHPIRNRNLETNEADVHGPYDQNPFTIDNLPGIGATWTPPFAGKESTEIADMAGSTATGRLTGNVDPAIRLGLGSANPVARYVRSLYNSDQAQFDGKDVVGPETSALFAYNPKAPQGEQTKQALTSLLRVFPIPAFSLEDSLRRGFKPEDLAVGLAEVAGLGYGTEHLDPRQRKIASVVKSNFLRQWQRYNYNMHRTEADEQAFQEAWTQYLDGLKTAGVLY